MRTFTMLIVILMTTISGCATDGQTVADDLAGAFGSPVNRPALDGYVQQSQAENAWMQAQTAEAQADIQMRLQTEQLRAKLATLWRQAGYSAAQAEGMADAYTPTSADNVIIASVKSRGAKSALAAIKSAVASYNYRLADQLLIAFEVASGEEVAHSAGPSSQ